jgi:hypothetical protein
MGQPMGKDSSQPEAFGQGKRYPPQNTIPVACRTRKRPPKTPQRSNVRSQRENRNLLSPRTSRTRSLERGSETWRGLAHSVLQDGAPQPIV